MSSMRNRRRNRREVGSVFRVEIVSGSAANSSNPQNGANPVSSGTSTAPSTAPTTKPATSSGSTAASTNKQSTSTQVQASTSSKKPKLKPYVMSHRYQKRRLSKADWLKKKSVLGKYHCPFGAECKQTDKCFFSHETENAAIKRLPAYACVKHIAGGCAFIPYSRKNSSRSKRCHRGLHLSYDELDNLSQFEEAHSQELRDRMCAVCFDYFPGHGNALNGYMVNCTHVFCLSCIKSCFESKAECPLCRTVGPYVESRKPLTNKIKSQARQKFGRRNTTNNRNNNVLFGVQDIRPYVLDFEMGFSEHDISSDSLEYDPYGYDDLYGVGDDDEDEDDQW